MLIQQEGKVLEGGKDYHYAACDAACDQPDSWRTGYVTSTWGTEISDAFLSTRTRRAFALDDEGNPGFVFYDRDYFHAEPDHLGGFYTWCDAGVHRGHPDGADLAGGLHRRGRAVRHGHLHPAGPRLHQRRSSEDGGRGDHRRGGHRAQRHHLQGV